MASAELSILLYRFCHPDEAERWTLRTWVVSGGLTVLAILGGWCLHRIPDAAFWPVTLSVEFGGLVFIMHGLILVDDAVTCYSYPASLFFLQAGTTMLGAGCAASLLRKPTYAKAGSVSVLAMQLFAQAFALISLFGIAGIVVWQAIWPPLIRSGIAIRSWHERTYKRPHQLVVEDLAAEAPGNCNICLCELQDDETSQGLLRLSCGHVFHTACIKDWLDRRTSCPMCRRAVGDIRRCTQIHRAPQRAPLQPSAIGGQAVVTLLEGRALRGHDNSEPQSPILSMLMPVQARASSNGPRSATLGAVPEAGSRSELPSPVELRPHSYRPPRMHPSQELHRQSSRSSVVFGGSQRSSVVPSAAPEQRRAINSSSGNSRGSIHAWAAS